MADYEIRIRVTGTTDQNADYVTWAVRRVLDTFRHLQITCDEPRLINPPGLTLEQLPAEVLARIEPGDYLSTACDTAFSVDRACGRARSAEVRTQLGEWVDRLHDRCRLNHKFTGQPCVCPCHQEAGR